MRTPFIRHIEQCSVCMAEPYGTCRDAAKLWRGDVVEMNAVNLHIQLRRKQYKLQRQLTDMAESSEEAALTEWPEIIG